MSPSCLDVNDVLFCQLRADKVVLNCKSRQSKETAGLKGGGGEEGCGEQREMWRGGCVGKVEHV